MALLNRGAAHAPSDAQRQQARIDAAAEETRSKWLNALLVDQTRAWMTIGEHEPGVLEGMAVMLTLAGMTHVYDAKRTDTPDIRIIRGAISAATQCAAMGGRVTIEDARAFSSAAVRAQVIIQNASTEALLHAALSVRKSVGLPEEGA